MKATTTAIYVTDRSPPRSITIVLDGTIPKPRKKCTNDHHHLITGATIVSSPLTVSWDGTFPNPWGGGRHLLQGGKIALVLLVCCGVELFLHQLRTEEMTTTTSRGEYHPPTP